MITLFFTGKPPDQQAAVEAEIETFDTKFQALGNEPLHKQEKALLRTFLIVALTSPAGTLPPAHSPTS